MLVLKLSIGFQNEKKILNQFYTFFAFAVWQNIRARVWAEIAHSVLPSVHTFNMPGTGRFRKPAKILDKKIKKKHIVFWFRI